MKLAPLALVVLFASLTFGQVTPAPKAPAPPTTVAPARQPVIEAGGLDAICQSGLNTPYNMDEKGFGSNDAKQSQALSDASACIGYVTGWAHTISGAFIIEEDQLWFVEVNDSFAALKAVDALHEYIKTNPDARLEPSPLALLNVSVDKKMATVSPVKIENLPHGQPQSEPNPAPPVLKSKA
jgi:hypothetical protein